MIDKYNTRVNARFGTGINHSLATKIELPKAGFYLHMPRVSICPTCGKRKDWRAKVCMECKWWGPEPSEKTCRGCGITYPIESYSWRPNGRGGHKRRSRCRNCENEYSKVHNKINIKAVKARARQYEKENPDKLKKWSLRSSWKRKGYNPDEIEELWKSHSGLCDICGLPPSGNRYINLAIDHDHVTGKIRGMLCNSCNLGLGKFKDDSKLLQKAIDYLKR